MSLLDAFGHAKKNPTPAWRGLCRAVDVRISGLVKMVFYEGTHPSRQLTGSGIAAFSYIGWFFRLSMDNNIPRNFPDVSLQALRSVLLIRDCKTAQAAANRAGVTISTLTRQISDLEEKLGVKLFDRLPRGMKLTTEGNSYAAAAARVFAELDRVQAEVKADRGEVQGHVRVFISEALVDDYLLREIHEIRKQHPRITVEATIAFADQARAALITQEADVATIFGMSRHEDIEILAKHDYPLIAVFGKDHPLAKAKSKDKMEEITAADLMTNHAVAVPSRAYATRALFEKLLPKSPERGGSAPGYSLVLNSLEHLRWYAMHGEAVAILPALSARRELESGDLKFLHLAGAKAAHSNLSLCRHRQIAPNPAARLLLERLTGANALWILDQGSYANTPPVRVTWPPAGYVPYTLVFPNWSLSYAGADFTGATVAMTRGGQPIPVQLSTLVAGYGDNTLVWTPLNADLAGPSNPSADEVATTVTVFNVIIDGQPTSFTYTVVPFDPNVTGTDTVVPSITGPTQLKLGTSGTYTFNVVPGATGYQWTARTVSPLTLLDDAENGLDGVTISPAGTDLIATTPGETGTACYQFISYPTETMTLNPVVLPVAGSVLVFNSELAYATAGETAEVQISSDGGQSWHDLYKQTGTGGTPETSFSTRSIDLSAYAGQACQVRFMYSLSSNGGYYPRGTNSGWYVDEITVTNAQTLGVGTPISVAANSSSFDFAPTDSGLVALQVTPVFYGTYPTDAGPLSIVTVGGVPAITGRGTASGKVGQSFAYQITASNTPVSFDAVGLPTGLAFNSTTGLISGIPTQSGTFMVSLSAVNAYGNGSLVLTLTIKASLPVVTLTATIPTVTPGTGQFGEFMLSLSAPLGDDLVIDYAVKGNAVNGVDYVLLSGTKKIKAGRTSKPIKVNPLGDLGGSAKKVVKLTISSGNGYTVGTSGKVKVAVLAGQ